MSEYIKREDAIQVLCNACGNAACPKDLIPKCSYYEKMQNVPVADVIERKYVENMLSVLRSRCHPGAEECFDRHLWGLLHIVTNEDLLKTKANITSKEKPEGK